MKENENKNIDFESVGIVFIDEKIYETICKMPSLLNFKGKTHISFSEGIDHFPIRLLDFKENEKVDDMYYSVRDLKPFKKYLDNYSEYGKKLFCKEWDNEINVISYNEEGYEVYRMIVSSEKDCFMAIIAYPEEKSKDVSEWQFTKRLKPYM